MISLSARTYSRVELRHAAHGYGAEQRGPGAYFENLVFELLTGTETQVARN